ncbi:TetR/AcrR family transcriptional regulator [Streptomyces sp. NPDC050560]|uniref:TetR/AcrR family transcriptional regulator n=1 Tax=Streptomyces sp. NPDC050560 TaxID=3365630 RepID=UPI0037A8239B
MSSSERPAEPVRRRDSAATKAAILAAAQEAFTEHGYDGAGTRDIARAAGVDARLIGRYFGSKEGLFAQVVDIAYEKSLMMTPEENAHAARVLLTAPDQRAERGLLLTLRSAANPRAAEIMRRSIERNYQRRLGEALPGEDTVERAALLVAFCSGILMSRFILRNSALTGPDAERLVPLLRAALDTVATASGVDDVPGGAGPRPPAGNDPAGQ